MTNNEANKPYTVCAWGSHPDADNDDCWVGEDYATREEAEAVFANAVAVLCKHTPSYDVAFFVLDGPDVHEVKANSEWSEPWARKARRADEREADGCSESAMQAGMAFGCDGYNDAMGF